MCTKPITAYQLLPRYWPTPDKAPQPVFRQPDDKHRYEKLPLPCRKCVSCLKVRSMTMAVQLACELQTTKGDSLFVTLTYDNYHLPSGHTLNKKHPELFIKKLRKYLSAPYTNIKTKRVSHKTVQPIRYKLVAEYGEKSFRPHYHLAIFNLSKFTDQQISDKNYSDTHTLFESEILTKIWGKGNVIYNLLTLESCLYIAQHSDKKINRKIDYSASFVDTTTGEVIEPPLQRFNKKDKQNKLILDTNGKPQTELRKQRVPEYTTGSSKPGLGTQWFKNFGKTDLHQGNILSTDGQLHKIPRHLMNLLEREIPELHQQLKQQAKAYAMANQRSQEQLDYQNKFDLAQLKYKKERNKI